MMKMRKFLPVLIIILLLAVISAGQADEAENLLLNADFSEVDSNGLPKYWYPEAYVQEEGFSSYQAVGGDPEYPHAAYIQNISNNDARFAQTVPVEPDTYYVLSGYIRTEDVKGGHGANLSFGEVYVFGNEQYAPLYNTEGKWRYVEYYGITGPKQNSVDVYARLGGYSGESTGKAWFAALSLRETDDIPEDVEPVLMYNFDGYNDTDEEDDSDDYKTVINFRSRLFLIIFIYTAAAFLAIRYQRGRDGHELQPEQSGGLFVAVILLSALILRVLISRLVEGYMVDVNCFLSWGRTMADFGPTRFYQATNFCDYPPLYTYVLALNSYLTGVLGGGEETARIVFRFIPSICDVAACWLLYRLLVQQKHTGKKTGMIFLVFAAFNPATILNSAAWGQMDSVLCLLLFAVSLCAMKNKWRTALPLYVAAVLVKPQALMLGPLGLTYIIITYIRNPETRKPILQGTGISLAVLAAGIIPFGINQNWDWLIQLYIRTLASYPYATVNTANFYYLLGGNWSAVGSQAHLLAPVFSAVLCALYGWRWNKRAEGMPKHMTETIISIVFSAAFVLCAVLRVSWAWTGGLAMAFVFVIVISHAVRSGRISLLPWLGGLLFILLYVFGVKMHERYVFPAFLLLAASWVILRERKILFLMLVFTLTVFLNEGIVLDNSIRLGSMMGHLNSDTVAIADTISLINVFGALYAVWLSMEILFPREGNNEKDIVRKIHNPLDWKCDRKLHWTGKDTAILSVITIIYTVITLLTLGSGKAPQTYWTSSSDDEQVIFDLGNQYEDVEILYFGQVSRHDFTFSDSTDGVHWSEEVWAQMDEGQCWKWQYVTDSYISNSSKREYHREFYGSRKYYIVRFRGRYIRLSAQQLGLKLNEILFRTPDGALIQARVLERNGGESESVLYSDPAALLDEQDSLEGLPSVLADEEEDLSVIQPSWWNSTYFDEIYHARTAYEFLHGTVPYETSHPPLGKVIMSLFVAVFGMTPFGWRFAGALAGILMLPGMYLIGKQLTKRTGIAMFSCLMMALDCLHLTQTQIATIDSFPVLFIIFAYFFMLRFIQTDFMKEKLVSTLMMLGFSGLFMGLSIASKWIGIYAGAGLAVLFFWHCWRTAALGKQAEQMERYISVLQPSCCYTNENISIDCESKTGQKSKEQAGEKLREIAAEYSSRPVMNRILVLCAWCVLFFVLVPVMIYLLSYLPYFAYKANRISSLGTYIAEVWNTQIHMFNYHSKPGLGMDHPFYSPWWQWPVIGKPMYYAAYQYLPADGDVFHSIFAFGNPVIWFGAIAALLICIIRALAAGSGLVNPGSKICLTKPSYYDVRYFFIIIGFLAQYLPWVLVPRGTYIYHYFASLPFLMMSIALCFDSESAKYRSVLRAGAVIFTVAAAVFFVLLFPYASGMNTSSGWLDIGRRILHIWY